MLDWGPLPGLPISCPKNPKRQTQKSDAAKWPSGREISRITHISSNGVGAVSGSNALSPVPSADKGSLFYGEMSRDPVMTSPMRSFPTLSPRARLGVQSNR
jgi:hypothetical protein